MRRNRQNPRNLPSTPSRSTPPSLPSVAWLVLGGLAIYVGWFLTRPLPSMAWLTPDSGPPTRLAVVIAYFSPTLLWRIATGDYTATFLDRIPLMAAGLGQLAMAWSCGRLLLGRWLPLFSLLSSARHTIYIAGGLQVLSLWTLILGLAAQLHWSAGFRAGGILVVVAAAWLEWRRIGRDSTHNSRWRPLKMPSQGDYPYLVALPWIGLLLGLAMLPPTDFDVREYHLQVPKEWYQAGQIRWMPHNIYGNMPLGAEMQALFAMGWWPGTETDRWWNGALIGKWVMSLYTILAAILVATLPLGHGGANEENDGRTATPWGALCLLSAPWVIHIGAAGLNENALGVYLFLAAWFCRAEPVNASNPQGTSPAAGVLAGFFWGAALSTKYTALLFGLPIPFLLARQAIRAQCMLRTLAMFTVACGLSGGLWYAKNAIFTGNPIYPLAPAWFGGSGRSPEQIEQWRKAHAVPSADDWGEAMTQAGQAIAAFAGTSEWQQGLWIPLALLGLTVIWRKPSARGWEPYAWLVWTLGAWWFCTHRLERFWVPALPWLAQAAALGATWTTALWWRTGRNVACAIVLVVHFVQCLSPSIQVDPRWLAPLAALRNDPQRVSSVHLFLNQTWPQVPNAKVLLVGDAQPFDLEGPTYYHTCFDPCLLEAWLKDLPAAQQRAALLARGVTWVYYDRREVQRYQSPGNYGFTPYVNDALFANFVKTGVMVPIPAIENLYRIPVDPPSESSRSGL